MPDAGANVEFVGAHAPKYGTVSVTETCVLESVVATVGENVDLGFVTKANACWLALSLALSAIGFL